jgi:hypothetical protein
MRFRQQYFRILYDFNLLHPILDVSETCLSSGSHFDTYTPVLRAYKDDKNVCTPR